jgi:hypothetical protein
MSRAGESRKNAADHANRYEMLRTYALERHAPLSRDGLVILLRHGMVAWMDAWSKLPAPLQQPAQAEPSKTHTIPDDTRRCAHDAIKPPKGHRQSPPS